VETRNLPTGNAPYNLSLDDVLSCDEINNERVNMTGKNNLRDSMADKKENINIRRGQKFTITLESNPTSGFKWLPSFDGSIISLLSCNSQSSTATRVGGSGKDIFTFKAVNSGETVLKMVYKRSWEQQSVAEQNFFIDVR
jgi:predicted secreted protein